MATITGLLTRHLLRHQASVGAEPFDCGRDVLEGRLDVGLGGGMVE